MKKSPPFIDFHNVTIILGNNVVLNAISVMIPDGEHVAILGPNGSGKSSFIKTIVREHYPAYNHSGTIFRTWGKELWDVFELRSLFGYISQDLQSSFNRNISGRDVILSGFFSSIGLFFHSITPKMEEKAKEISEFLEISHLMNRPLNTMSTGQARRFLIGRALVHDPRVLILDEPSNSLDLTALHLLRSTMQKVAKKTVIILVTHSLPDIIPDIKRVLLFKDGKIFRDGVKEEVLTNESISSVFEVPVKIRREDGFYYATGY
ncbi:MAG: ATP-binding cassette domain-containing protein [Methanomicrobiales archaeon]|nr:ATP-binding cassette domain-containing protein [Methanomicrobiales archaeon]